MDLHPRHQEKRSASLFKALWSNVHNGAGNVHPAYLLKLWQPNATMAGNDPHPLGEFN